MKIPQHILEAINCGEISANKYYDIYGKENIENELAKLRLCDEKFFKENPTYASFTNNKTTKTTKRFSYSFISAIGSCAAAILFAFLFITTPKNSKISNNTIREKGDKIGLFIYRKNGESIELLKQKSLAKEGDALQIAFNEEKGCYGVIFSVDGNGNVTNHYPDDSFKSVELYTDGGTNYLNYSYVLDDAPDYELFFMVTSKLEFEIDTQKIKGLSLKELKKGSFLPKDTEFSTFLVKK